MHYSRGPGTTAADIVADYQSKKPVSVGPATVQLGFGGVSAEAAGKDGSRGGSRPGSLAKGLAGVRPPTSGSARSESAAPTAKKL